MHFWAQISSILALRGMNRHLLMSLIHHWGRGTDGRDEYTWFASSLGNHGSHGRRETLASANLILPVAHPSDELRVHVYLSLSSPPIHDLLEQDRSGYLFVFCGTSSPCRPRAYSSSLEPFTYRYQRRRHSLRIYLRWYLSRSFTAGWRFRIKSAHRSHALRQTLWGLW